MNEEQKKMLLDFGALNYSDDRIATILDLSPAELKKLMSAGGREVYDQGKIKFEYRIDAKLMELGLSGDLKALQQMKALEKERKMQALKTRR